MKKLSKIIIVLLLISSCDVNIFEAPFDPRLNFVGAYEAEEFSETFGIITYYNVDIVTDGDSYSNDIYLRNFYGYSIEVFASVSGDRFTIPRQQVDFLVIEGTGKLQDGAILLTYSVSDLRQRRVVTDFCNTVLY